MWAWCRRRVHCWPSTASRQTPPIHSPNACCWHLNQIGTYLSCWYRLCFCFWFSYMLDCSMCESEMRKKTNKEKSVIKTRIRSRWSIRAACGLNSKEEAQATKANRNAMQHSTSGWTSYRTWRTIISDKRIQCTPTYGHAYLPISYHLSATLHGAQIYGACGPLIAAPSWPLCGTLAGAVHKNYKRIWCDGHMPAR